MTSPSGSTDSSHPSLVSSRAKYDWGEYSKLLPPPIPLMPKSLCTDVEPKSYLSLLCVLPRRMRRFAGEEEQVALGHCFQDDRQEQKQVMGLRMAVESWCVPHSSVVYRRSALGEKYNANEVDLRKMKRPKILSTSLNCVSSEKSEDSTLAFESRFESGNLAVASKKGEFEYNLLLQNDTNSRGNTQWFYFQVSNTTNGHRVRFNILNLGKGGSLFSSGMKILVLSQLEHVSKGLSWQRDCEDISYGPNNIRKEGNGKHYFTLSFTYQFPHTADTVFFAYSYPYTYSDLLEDLKSLETDPVRSQYMTRKELCSTLMGNRCDYLTISGASRAPQAKKGVFLSARVHPGETVGSWMMKGLLEFLTSAEHEAQILRENYVFKIIPMLNPDGVIHGNYRCGLAGADLNRRWKYPSKTLHPTVYHAKRLIKLFSRERELQLLCDMHGHSRRKNVFMYGCPVAEDPSISRLFPFILSKVSPFFSYRGCSFKLQDDKEQTQRITMFKETAIPAIYTLEATFSGMSIGPFAGQHLTASQLQLIGKHVCLALLIYGNHVPPQAALPQPSPDDSGSQPESAYMKFSDISREDCERELGKCIETGDASDEEGGSSGSDSSPSEDNLDPEELSKLLPAVPISKAERTQRKVMPRQASAAQARRAKEETKTPAKCQSCLEPLLPNHICAKLRVLKPLSNPYSRLYTKRVGLNTYVSPVTGKTMHDQATQTPKPGTVLEYRSRSLPASGTSTREGVAASQKLKEVPVDARGRPEPKLREEQKPGSPEKRLPVIQKPGVRESSAPLKQRRV